MDYLTPFETPIFTFSVDGTEALNDALRRALSIERESSPGVQASNAGGWHSTPDLAQRSDPPYRDLMGLIVEHVGVCTAGLADQRGLGLPPHRWGVHGWAMIMDTGDHVLVHDHSQADWSIAWYVDAGDTPTDDTRGSGLLTFLDPRRATPRFAGVDLFPSTFTVQPRTGMLVVFPGYLQHYVQPYRGSTPRIAVSCNLTLEPVELS